LNNEDWEYSFGVWADGPSNTQAEKAERAESVVRSAIEAHAPLMARKPRVFAQGSYAANTNIGLDSDVDICVLITNPFFPEYPQGVTREMVGNGDADISFAAYKGLVEDALVKRFKAAGVTRGTKAFDVHENTYRVDADVVPALEYRRYTDLRNASGAYPYQSGIAFDVDGGGRIINWPDQTRENGVAKNNDTGRRYKKVVRVLKGLRNYMQEKGVEGSEDIASFLIESLVWNVPDPKFQQPALHQDVRSALVWIWNVLETDQSADVLFEVNGIKKLFDAKQPWTRQRARGFIGAAWTFLEFK
jgi:hypothetical protein